MRSSFIFPGVTARCVNALLWLLLLWQSQAYAALPGVVTIDSANVDELPRRSLDAGMLLTSDLDGYGVQYSHKHSDRLVLRLGAAMGKTINTQYGAILSGSLQYDLETRFRGLDAALRADMQTGTFSARTAGREDPSLYATSLMLMLSQSKDPDKVRWSQWFLAIGAEHEQFDTGDLETRRFVDTRTHPRLDLGIFRPFLWTGDRAGYPVYGGKAYFAISHAGELQFSAGFRYFLGADD